MYRRDLVLKFKREIMAVILIICMLFTISSISAADSSTDAISVTNTTVKAVNDDLAYDNLAMKNDVEILSETDGGTYADLNSKISGASANSVIYFENDYEYTDDSPDSITISIDNLTIDGKGHFIDAKEKCRIFASTNKLTLKNIKFLNAKSSTGAVYCQSTDLVIDNCTFINNVANNYGGGAICVWSNSKAKIINSNFKGNLNSGTRLNGGAISVNGYVLVDNCTFEENSGTYYGGGAVGIYTSGSADISNSTFLSNHATDDGGGAIENYGSVNIDRCIFMDNTAVYAGSALYLYGSGTVKNSIFINNPDTIISASSGSTASHNWFGTTTKNYQTSIPDVSQITMTDYYVLDLNLVNNDESATVSLNNLLENDVVTTNCEYTLPIIDLTVDAMGITVPNGVRLESNGMANIAHEPADAYSMTISFDGVNLITEEIKPSFSLLSNKISSDGVTEIILQQDYIYDSSKDSILTNGIEFAKDMTIDGQGHLIDAKQSSNIFYFNDETNSYSLTLKNIIFANATGTNGAAVYFKGKKIEIINCTFINNKADSEGDAIYIADATSTDNRITGSEFTDNTGSNSIAYVNLDSTDAKLKLSNSIFMKNTAAKNIKGTSNVVAEYNWWGNTIENKADILKIDGITVNNWLFLKIDADAVKQGTAKISLNNVYDGSAVSTYSDYALRPLTFTLGGTNTALSSREITLGDNGQADYQFRMYRTNAALTATYDDITTTKELDYTIVDDGSFKALSDLVWFSGDVLELTHDYVYSDIDTITEGIVIPKKITINGNGHTIDAKGKTRIFAPEGGVSQVTLNNISFVNAKSGQGSVILIPYTSDDWNILNCNFTNNTATMFGGVIDCIGDYCTIDNCNFINNTARYASVIRYNHDNMAYIKNSNFINNAATDGDDYGGVIYAQDGKVTIDKSLFMNNQVQGTLGSVLNTNKGATITNSIFLNNTGSGNIIYGTYSLSVQSSWFGNTFENLNNEPSNYHIFNPKWLYLDFKFMEENVIISLNNLYDKSTATSSVYSEYNLPEITLNLNSTNLNLNTDKVTLDSTGKAIVPYTKIADDAALTVSYNDISLTKDFAIGEFDLLQDLIDTAAGDTIELNRNYTFIEGVDTLTNGISITRDITIDGKGHTINGSNLARILYITTNGVTLKNINFVDGYATHGGAIYNNGGSGFKLINCTFENNVAYNNPGGAIYTYSNGENDFINCTFIANKMTKANQYGGAVYIYENSGRNNFIGCAFINNSAYYAGAIATGNGKAITNIDKSIFITNTANNYPSIYIRGGSAAEFYLKNSIIFSKGLTTDTATQVYAYYTLRASDVNYNWWMHTADNKAQSAYVRCSGGGLTVNKYLFLDMDCESDIATISINNVYDKSSGTTSKYDGELPQITFDISGTNVVVDDTATLNGNGVAEAAYDMTAQTGSLTATYNSVSITKQLTVDDSFTTLQAKISRAMEGSELLLYHDYNYDDTKDSALMGGIVIDRDLTIDGQGFTVDAKNTGRIFKIDDNTKNIVLKNINFVNAVGDDGAAVYANCNNIEIINCTFENNGATGDGDALYVVANNCNITESTFVNNVGSVSTIYLDSESDAAAFNIDNSILVNNGGADVVKAKGALTADYNWWGNTADDANDLSGGLAQKWYILDMTVDDAKSIATLSLNNLNDGTTYENYALPSITLNMQATNGFVRKDEVTLDENGYATVGYLATDAGASLTAEYNAVSITREITYDADSDYSFKALKKLIDQVNDNDVITLTHDYDYVIGYDDAITAGIDIVKKNLTINGNGFTIDAKGKTRIFYVKDSGSNLTIRNVTFSNGKMSANGGAILWYGDDGNLENCTFINNDAGSYSGGAIYAQGDNLNISNSRFIDNKASKAAGIYVFSENVTIKNSTFINNGGGSYGGAISVKANNLNIINSTFTGNTVTYQGGALYLDDGNDVNIVDSRFINNFASTSGGAIYWVKGKNRNITNSTFTNNKATTSGGAIYLQNSISGAETTIYDSTFFNNTATSGGAIYIYSGSLDINKTEFIDNAAQSTSTSAYGGAIYDTSSDKVTIANSNFTGNFAKTRSSYVYAGVIYTTTGEIDIANSTFNKNSIDSVSGIYIYGSVIYWKDANGKITNSSFLNNHGKSSSSSAIYISGDSSNANVTNSIFINNNYGATDTLKVLTRSGGNIEFNDCWFGNTKDNPNGNDVGTTTGDGITYNNKLYLSTVHDEYMAVGENKEIKFVLQYIENGNVIIYDASKLPKVDLTLSSVNGGIDKNSASIDEIILFNADHFGDASITGKYNGIELTENLYAKDKPTIVVEEPIIVHVDESISVNVLQLIPQDASLTFSSIDGDEYIYVASNGYVGGLKEGTSTLYINYGGNENYVPATVEVPVTVIKYTTSMSCDVDSIAVDWGADSQSVTIDFDSGNPNLNPLNPGQYDHFEIKYKSNDTKVATVSVVEGKPYINFHSAGTANVTFYFEENEKYYASEKNITVTVNKVPSSVSFSNDVEFDFGSSGTTTLTLVGVSGVSVSVESYPGAAVVFNSETNVTTVSGLNAGTYTLKVISTPDENHTSVTETAVVTVNKVDSSVGFDGSLDFDYGSQGNVTLVDFVGCDVLLSGIVVVGHPEAVIGLENNVITVSGLKAGSYTLNVTTRPDGNHKSVNVSKEFTVNKVPSSVTFSNDVVFDYGGSNTTTLTLIGVDGVSVSVENHNEAIVVFNSETNVTTVSGLNAGTYTLIVTTAPDENHTAVTETAVVTVNKVDSSVGFDGSLDFDYGSQGTVTLVDFVGCDVQLNDIVVVGHNEAVISIENNVITVSGLKAGDYTLNVTTNPDGNHNSVNVSKKFTVNKVPSSVTFSNDVEFDFGDSGTTTLTLVGVSGVSVSVENHPEAIVVFNSETNVTTVSGLNAGTYTLIVTTAPDENHTAVTETAVVTVNKVDSSVGFDGSLDFDYGSQGTVTLVDFVGCDVLLRGIGVVGHNEAVIAFENNVITVSGLDAGDYTLNVTTRPDDNHNSVNVSKEFTVNKINSSVTLDNVEFDYLRTGNTTITSFDGCTVDKQNITVEGHPEAVIDFENNVISVSGLGAGTYTLNVATTPDSNHKSVNVRKNIKVNPIPSQITLNSTDIIYEYDESNKTMLTLVGCSVDLVNITVDGNNVAGITYDAETKVITLSGIDAGTHTLKVITTPDENHTSVYATASVTVLKSNSSVEFSNSIALFYSEEGSTTLTLNGCSIDLENITVVGHPEANIRYENNVITVSGLEQGKYTLKVITTPDSNHYSVEKTISVSVDKESPKLAIEYSNVTVGEKEFVYVSMRTDGDVNITIFKGDSVMRTENLTISNSGFNKTVFTDLKVGTYVITAYYKGQGRFNDSTIKYELVIRPIYEYDFSAAVNNTVVGNKTNVTVNLPAGASGKLVIGDIEADVKGTQTIIELAEQTQFGKNNVIVKYVPDEDSKYAGRELTVFYDVAKVDTEIALTVVNKTTADPVTITAAIKAEGNVTFIINGKKYSREIKENAATLELTDVAGGEYNVTAVYEGNDKYAGSSANDTYTVEKIDSAISIDITPDAIKTDQNATVTVTVDGSGIVTFTVNGIKTNVSVDGGVAKLTIDKLAKGTTVISAEYLGDGKYNRIESQEKTLTVNPVTDYDFTLEIANITVGEKAIAYVFLPVDVTNKTNITVKLGDEIVLSENMTLKLTIPDLSVGTYNITARYYGDSKYDEKTIVNEFSVNPLNGGKLNFTVSVNSTVLGNTTNVTVNLPDDASGSIVIGDIVKAIEGRVTVIELPVQTTAGINNVTVKYVPDANSRYGEENITAFYNVAKKIAEITIDPIDVKAGDNVKINARAYEGAVIIVSVDGIETKSLENISAGKHTVIATVAETDEYLSASANYTFEVSKSDVGVITVTGSTTKVGGNSTINITFAESDVTGIVVVNVNGNEYSFNINSQESQFNIVMPNVGNATISARYLGNYKYNAKDAESSIIEVTEKDERTDYKVPDLSDVKVDDELNITVPSGVDVYVDGVKQTPVDGNVTVPSAAGNHTVIIVANETDDTKAVFEVINYEVSKKDIEITVSGSPAKVNEISTIAVNITHDATGIVVINVNGSEFSLNISMNKTLEVVMPNVGNATLSARYLGDDKYNTKDAKSTTIEVTDKKQRDDYKVPDLSDVKVDDELNITVPSGVDVYVDGVKQTPVDGNVSVPSAAGNHTVIIVAEETKDSKAVFEVINYTVNKHDVGMLVVTGSETKVGGNSTINIAFIVPDVTGIVVVNVNGTEYSFNISQQTSKFEVIMPNVGNATLSARYLGNYKYDAKDAVSSMIEVTEKDDVDGIVVPDLSDVNVDDELNITVPSGVDVYVDGVKQTPVDGNVSVPSAAGNHTIVIVANETDDTKAVFKVINYEVTKNDVEIKVSGSSTKVNEISTITVNINPDATGIVVINVNGSEFSLNISMNKTLKVVMPNVGNATLSARYLGDDKYNAKDAESTTIEVTDKKQRDDYKVPDLSDVKVGNNLEITVPSGVDVYVDGVKQTPEGDKVTLPSTAGDHSIIIVANETKDTKAVFEVRNYTVSKNDVNILVSGTSAKVNEKSTVTVDITPGATGIVVVTVNDTEYSLSISDPQTQFEIIMLNVGNAALSARYLGNDKYNAKDADSTIIEVSDKSDSIVEIQDPELIVGGEGIQIKATVNGAGADIIYTINGNQNDVIAKVQAITYTITAIFEGNSTHKANSTSKVITVGKKQSTLEILPPEITIGEPVIFEINPGDRKDVVIVYIDGVKYDYDVNQQNVEFANTTAGTHTIVASLSETDEYLPASDNYTFTIDKKDSSIEIRASADSIFTGEQITLTVNINEGNAAIVLVNVNGTVYSLNAGDNELTVVLDKVGTYTINATYMGDDIFKSNNSNVETVEVSEKSLSPISIEIPEVNKAGEDVVINITAPVTPEVYVDGKKQTCKDGKVTVSGLDAGSHLLEVIVAESETSKANSTSVLFNVDKKDSTIEITTSDDSAYVGGTITVYFNTVEGADGTVLVNVNGTVYSLTVSDGKLDVVLDNVGTYTINATYNGNEIFNSNNSNVKTVEVTEKAASAIDVQIPEVSKVGDDIVINITAQVTPEVYVDGKKQSYKDGKVTVSGLGAGTHVIEVIVPESESGKANSTVKTFDVSKKESSIEVISIDGDKIVDENLKVNLKFEGNNIIVYLDGEVLSDYELFKASAGNHTITASVVEDDEYLSSVTNATFEVLKKDVDIHVSGTYVTVGEKSTITVDIAGVTGIVVVNVNGTEYSLNLSKTNTLEVVLNEAGEYDISATFIGDDKYNPAKASDTVIVFDKKLVDIEITIPAEYIYAGDDVTVFVDYIGDANLTVTVDGVIQDLNNGQFIIEDVRSGIHTIEVISPETMQYQEFTAVEIFEAVKKSSEVSVNIPSDIKAGDDVEVQITSYEGADIDVTLDGVKQTVTDGKLKFRATAGNHTITARVDETGRYLGNSTEKTFTVSKLDAEIEVTGTDITQGQATIITVSTDLDEGVVIVKLNDTEIAIDLAKSKSASVVIDAPGEYLLSAKYMGSDIYNPAEAAGSTVKVAEKITPAVEVDVPEIKAGESETITVSIPNATGNVHVIVDGIEEIIPLDENGKANYTVPKMSAGSHSIVVVYPGDDKHEAKVVTQKIDVAKQSTKADITTPTDIKEGENATVSVEIPGATGNVSVIIDGKETVIKLDENGKANYTIPEMGAGNHSVVVIYPGDDTHDSTYSAASFSVEGEVITPKLSTEFTNINLTGDLRVQAVLKDSEGNPIAGAVINYSVGSQPGTVKTAEDGSFAITGKNNVVVTLAYAGDDRLEPTNISIKIDDVAPAVRLGSKLNVTEGVSIKTYAVDTPAGEIGSLAKFRLTDSNGDPIVNATIKFAYKTVILNRTTDKDGIVFIGINTQVAQEALCALSYVGDERYDATFVAFSFDIQKKPITISAASKSYKASAKTKKYTVTLKTEKCNSFDGKVYLCSGKKVTMKINGKTYSGKINDKGQVTFSLKISKKGKYAAAIKFAGDKTYASASKSVKITIK